LVKKAINEHADYNTAELDRSHPFKKEAAIAQVGGRA
jgi:hypothetical protein